MNVKSNKSEGTKVYNMHLVQRCISQIMPLFEFISTNSTNKDNFLDVS
jgi:hypothetical protein